ncbi:MAG: S8 family serine peptidase [Candidatus Aminicenantes bacterium]|nr:S8 family serine peptidase [Candidatus Aminicenantes bacterium]
MSKNFCLNLLASGFLFILVIFGFSFPSASFFKSGQDKKISPFLLNKLTQDENNRFTVWIYFQDKGPDLDRKIDEIRVSLPWENMIRRLKVLPSEKIVDDSDVPVWENYVNKIRPFLFRLRHTSRWLNALSAEVSGFNLPKIASFPFVSKIEEVKVHHFKLPEPDKEIKQVEIKQDNHLYDYGPSYKQLNQINVPRLHDLGLTGQGIIIAMLDSGFNNLAHQALAHLRIVDTWDFVNNDPMVADEPGQMGSGDHGTETLSVIGGFYAGKLIGPAFRASFLLAKTENTVWERHIEEDHWIAGVEWAEARGAQIVSSSLGYRDGFTHGEADYTWQNMDGQTTIVTKGANLAARKGLLIVNSAGNEGTARPPNQNTLVAPADSFWVLAVGAVDASGQRVSFSSVGPTADGRIKPDVMAMGRSVYSASPSKIDEYIYVSGTSFSCPLVAGAAALGLEANPHWSNFDIMQALRLTATRASNPDNLMGYGLIDAFKAAHFSLKEIYPPTHFALKRIENNFGFFKEYIDVLTWRQNDRNYNNIVAYRLYALNLKEKSSHFFLLAELKANIFKYEHRGLLRDEEFLYKITSVDSQGRESDPLYARR